MIKRFIRSKLFFLCISLMIIGFFIGYDYAVITSRNNDSISSNISDNTEKDNADLEYLSNQEKH